MNRAYSQTRTELLGLIFERIVWKGTVIEEDSNFNKTCGKIYSWRLGTQFISKNKEES